MSFFSAGQIVMVVSILNIEDFNIRKCDNIYFCTFFVCDRSSF